MTLSPPPLRTQLITLANTLDDKFMAVFKSYYHSIGGKDHVHLKTNQYLNKLMNLYLKLGFVIHGAKEFDKFAADFELRIFEVITSILTTKILTSISKSAIYDPTHKAILCSILEISKFLDTQTKDLNSFVICFDKIFLYLSSIKETLTDPKQDDIIFKTLTTIFRGLVRKAILEFEQSEQSQNIDLSNDNTVKLKKRLEILMSTISYLLKSQIVVKLSMKVKEDPLIAILFQLHSAIYSGNKTTLSMINKWINTHKHYDLAGFQSWLLSKMQKRSPIVVLKKDCDTIYAQFVSESIHN